MSTVETGVRMAAVIVMLAMIAPSAVAQDREQSELCLVVESPVGLGLDDPAAIQAAVASGSVSIVGVVPCQSVSEAVTGTGDWVVGDIEPDPESGAPTAAAYLYATSGSSSRGNPALLMVRCPANGQPELAIDWDEDLGDGNPTVETMVGTDDVDQRDWWPSTVGATTTFYPGDAIGFVDELVSESWFVAKATPPGGTPISAVFYLAGIEDALANVHEACGLADAIWQTEPAG
jgi:hypothetical protein